MLRDQIYCLVQSIACNPLYLPDMNIHLPLCKERHCLNRLACQWYGEREGCEQEETSSAPPGKTPTLKNLAEGELRRKSWYLTAVKRKVDFYSVSFKILANCFVSNKNSPALQAFRADLWPHPAYRDDSVMKMMYWRVAVSTEQLLDTLWESGFCYRQETDSSAP